MLSQKNKRNSESKLLLYAVYFSLGMVACLTALEVTHLVVLGKWNSEIFAVIAGLVGNITGIFLTQKRRGEGVGGNDRGASPKTA
ncbi:MAG: hypothetical protein ACUVTB_04435 [Candidatus Bathycorpusculaceae bacterium]